MKSKLHELTRLRRAQGYGQIEVVEEFELLRSVTLEAVEEELDAFDEPPLAKQAVEVTRKVASAFNEVVREVMRSYSVEASRDHHERAELLSSFGRAVTHELRNRLHTALLALDILQQQSKFDAAATPLVAQIERSLKKAEGVAADVFAAIVTENRRDHVPGRREAFSVLVEALVADLQIFADQQEVALETAGVLPDFQVDAARVQLVLVNLMNNAIKYADSRKERKYVRLSAHKTWDDGSWRVDVVDNGRGIPERHRDEVFIRNVRLHGEEGTALEDDGEGLGLTLAREAVAKLGGRLWLSMTPGGGSTFSFTIREPDAALRDAP